MAKLLSLSGATGCVGCTDGAGAYYSPAIERSAVGAVTTSISANGFTLGSAAKLFTSPITLGLSIGGGYLVGREFGVPVLGAIGAGLFGMLGLLGAVLIGASQQQSAVPNRARRNQSRRCGGRRARRNCR